MNKTYLPIVLALTSVMFLAGCATETPTSTNGEPEQGTNNQEFIVQPPVEGEVDPDKYVVQGLPEDLPPIPLSSVSYVEGSYSKSSANTGNQVWSISIIEPQGTEQSITDEFLNAGYSQTLTLDQTNGKAQGFENASYTVLIATTEANAGTPYSYSYTITALTSN